MKNDLIRRSYLCEVRAEGDGGNVIVGRPIVYDRATDICGYFEEIIERGALDGADLTDVRFLVNHDTSRIPLARSRRNNGNSTMQLLIDDEGLNISTEASCAKMFATEMCSRVADRGVQIHGGAGYISEYAIERFYRDVRLFRLYEGTTQIQQVIIARNMIREVED